MKKVNKTVKSKNNLLESLLKENDDPFLNIKEDISVAFKNSKLLTPKKIEVEKYTQKKLLISVTYYSTSTISFTSLSKLSLNLKRQNYTLERVYPVNKNELVILIIM